VDTALQRGGRTLATGDEEMANRWRLSENCEVHGSSWLRSTTEGLSFTDVWTPVYPHVSG